MKRSKRNNLVIDWKGTKQIRDAMAGKKLIKITINVDSQSLASLKKESEKTGVPYQRLLNSLLKEGLEKHGETESRLEKLEHELEKVKKKLAA